MGAPSRDWSSMWGEPTPPLTWRRWPTSNPAFPFEIISWPQRVHLSDFIEILRWCDATIGPGPGADANLWRAVSEERRVVDGKEVWLTTFAFKREAHCAMFVLAWTGEQTPLRDTRNSPSPT